MTKPTALNSKVNRIISDITYILDTSGFYHFVEESRTVSVGYGLVLPTSAYCLRLVVKRTVEGISIFVIGPGVVTGMRMIIIEEDNPIRLQSELYPYLTELKEYASSISG